MGDKRYREFRRPRKGLGNKTRADDHKRTPHKANVELSEGIQDIMTDIEIGAKRAMARVGLTDEDLATIPPCSFDDFCSQIEKIVKRKKKNKK